MFHCNREGHLKYPAIIYIIASVASVLQHVSLVACRVISALQCRYMQQIWHFCAVMGKLILPPNEVFYIPKLCIEVHVSLWWGPIHMCKKGLLVNLTQTQNALTHSNFVAQNKLVWIYGFFENCGKVVVFGIKCFSTDRGLIKVD